jgi:hypothetical protein
MAAASSAISSAGMSASLPIIEPGAVPSMPA